LAGFVNGHSHNHAQISPPSTTTAIVAQSPCQFTTFEDLIASDLRASFTTEADTRPYAAVERRQSLLAANITGPSYAPERFEVHALSLITAFRTP
jgi:hypothetical protein